MTDIIKYGNPRHVIFHIPHDGNRFPEELMNSICIPETEFMTYHEEMRDSSVSTFIPEEIRQGTSLVCFEVSRLLCDVERFIGPDEIMEHYGMGFCYEKACDGRQIKAVTPELKQATRKYYDAHHTVLDALMNEYQRSLLIDLHSFSEKVLWSGFTRKGPLPDICIGADEKFTPKFIVDEAERIFRDEGFTVAINYPYTGTMVPNAVYSGRIKRDLISVMIEVNKTVYLELSGNVDEKACLRIQKAIGKLIKAASA